MIGDKLSTTSTKTTIELNLAVLKITHEVKRPTSRVPTGPQLQRSTRTEPKTPKNALHGRQMPSVDIYP